MNLRGAIGGIGEALTYTGQQGMAEQQQARRDQVLADRQMAIEALQQRNREQSADANLERQKKLDTWQTDNNTRGKVAELRAAAPLRREEKVLEATIDNEKAEADYRRDIAKLEKQHGYRLSESQFESGLQATRDAAARGERVVAEGIDGDGNVTVVYANNRTTRMVGLKPKPSRSDDDDYQPTGRGGRPILTPRKSTAAPAAPNTAATADDMFRTLYANATPEKYPRLYRNGKKLSFDEAHRLYQGSQ